MKYFIVISLLLFSCNKQKRTNLYSIPEPATKDTLFAKFIQIDSKILKPIKTFIINNYLVVYDRSGNDMFKVFEIPNLKFLYCHGKIGRGPDEFSFIPDRSIKGYGNKLILLDNFRYKELLIENDKMKTIKSQPIKVGVYGVDNFMLLNDSIYICDDRTGETSNEFLMINLKNKSKIKSFGYYPEFGKNIKSMDQKYTGGYKTITYRPIDGRIAVFYLYLNRMKIFDKNGILLSEVVVGKDKILNHVPNEYDLLYRPDVYSGTKFIYALNINAPVDSVFNNDSKFKPQIEIWDWEGKLHAVYKLNKAILSFTVSEKYNKIYATTLDEIDKIYEFHLPKQ